MKTLSTLLTNKLHYIPHIQSMRVHTKFFVIQGKKCLDWGERTTVKENNLQVIGYMSHKFDYDFMIISSTNTTTRIRCCI
jgi:L-lysine 2,3-aminomutase